ncbi:hypothetical protein TNCV_2759741 [Trichonephila clavipes]|nr:hypothetical protein TNCV_2759741 [Trichonephila clavipes]
MWNKKPSTSMLQHESGGVLVWGCKSASGLGQYHSFGDLFDYLRNYKNTRHLCGINFQDFKTLHVEYCTRMKAKSNNNL